MKFIFIKQSEIGTSVYVKNVLKLIIVSSFVIENSVFFTL